MRAARQVAKQDSAIIWQAVTLAVNEKGDPSLRIDMPLLLLHGDRDRAGTICRDMPPWGRQEPRVTYQIIPDAAHNANQDRPEFANRAITAFLKSIV